MKLVVGRILLVRSLTQRLNLNEYKNRHTYWIGNLDSLKLRVQLERTSQQKRKAKSEKESPSRLAVGLPCLLYGWGGANGCCDVGLGRVDMYVGMYVGMYV